VTDSEFSRREVVAAYGIDPGRVDVVPLGVSPRFTLDADVAREAVVLHVGDLHPRRNLSMLLDVVLALRQTHRECGTLRLVLAGTDRGVLPSLRQQAATDAEALVHVGTPGDEELVGWYRRAAVFAYPSLYEGFGLPTLEAMACGTPVVASSAGAVPEVVASAGRLVGPHDTAAWRESIHSVLTDARLAGELSARGVARAATFTWDATARTTDSVYRRALEERSR
jgi:glycosyltransferase involved in cell wall biosynthesis